MLGEDAAGIARAGVVARARTESVGKGRGWMLWLAGKRRRLVWEPCETGSQLLGVSVALSW